MKLEQSDAELFYQLWFPLLDFVNRKHHVCPETETIGQRKGIDARNAKKTLGCLLLYAARFDAYGLPMRKRLIMPSGLWRMKTSTIPSGTT